MKAGVDMGAKLTVALEEGFFEEHVVVAVNGETRYEAERLTTRLQIGRADLFETTVDPGEVRIRISLPNSGVSKDITVPVEDELAIGISIEQGEIVYRKTPLRYA